MSEESFDTMPEFDTIRDIKPRVRGETRGWSGFKRETPMSWDSAIQKIGEAFSGEILHISDVLLLLESLNMPPTHAGNPRCSAGLSRRLRRNGWVAIGRYGNGLWKAP